MILNLFNSDFAFVDFGNSFVWGDKEKVSMDSFSDGIVDQNFTGICNQASLLYSLIFICVFNFSEKNYKS